MKISLFSKVDAQRPNRQVEIEEFFDDMKSDLYKEEIKYLRKLYKKGFIKEYKKEKNRLLPAVTFCVECVSRQATYNKDGEKTGPSLREKIIVVNRVAIIDYDDEHNPHVDWSSKEEEFKKDPYVCAVFRSPNGRGIKVLVKYKRIIFTKIKITDDLAGDVHFRKIHKFFFEKIVDYLSKHGLKADMSGSDPFRMCFASYDPQLYHNPQSKILKIDFANFAPAKTSLATVAAMIATPPIKPVCNITKKDKEIVEAKLRKAARVVAQALDGNRHSTRLKQGRLIGGYIASGYIDYQTAFDKLVKAALSNTDSPASRIENDIQCGIAHGMQSPLLVDQLIFEIKNFIDFDDNDNKQAITPTYIGLTYKQIKSLVYNPERDDAGLLMSIFQEKLVYVLEMRKNYLFQNIWKPVSDTYNTYLLDVLIDIYQKFLFVVIAKKKSNRQEDKWDKLIEAVGRKIKKLKTAAYKNNVLSYVRERSKSIVEFDAKAHCFPFLNGVLDLAKREFRQHLPSDYAIASSKYNYDPQATCPRWMEFLNLIFCGDQQLIEFMQKQMGLCLTAETNQSFLFCYGTGRNGKTQFFDVIGTIIGDFCLSDGSFMIENNGGRKSEYYDAQLKGKRMAIIPEAKRTSKLDENLKKYTANDTISGRYPGGIPFEFPATFTIIIYGNHKIKVTDDTKGFWRRVRFVPFLHSFPESSTDDYTKHRETYLGEAPGIANWMVEGFYKYKDEGMQIPDVVKMYSDQYRETSLVYENNIDTFIEATTDVEFRYDPKNNDAVFPVEKFYKFYQEWCEKNGESYQTNAALTSFLKERGHCRESNRKSVDGTQARCYFGIEKLAEPSAFAEGKRRLTCIKGGK